MSALASVVTIADSVSTAVLPRLRPGRSAAHAERSTVPHARAARAWERRYVYTLLASDLAGALLATGIAYIVRFGTVAPAHHLSHVALSALLPVCWLAVLAVVRVYEPRMLFDGMREYQRILRAGAEFTAGTTLVSYAVDGHVSRVYLVTALGLTTVFALAGRVALRRRLHRARANGHHLRRVVAVGHPAAVAGLTAQLHRRHHHGMRVVAACVPGSSPGEAGATGDAGVPVFGNPEDAAAAAAATGADTVVVLAGPELDGPALRRLGWQLENDEVDLIVASSLMDVTGSRITVRPVDGLPLLHVEHPRLGGTRRLVKSALDRTVAAAALVAISPVLLLVAVLVRLDSAGPVLFRQTRIGRHGKPFTMVKFRTMSVDASSRVAELAGRNEQDGVLFKMRQDPRVTRVGRVLRRYSLDELPQLVNVLTGQMSLVGPRPPLADEVARYPADMRRRLVVKPGLTGLWQVSGRSDLSWDESVRLDLHYVQNWALSLDLIILLRTVSAVVRGSGAY